MVGNMSERIATTWQDFLGYLIEDNLEKQRLAQAVHVLPITLQRWASGVSRPRAENMRLLVKHLPATVYAKFVRLAAVDFPDLFQEDLTESPDQEISAQSYARVLAAFACTPQPMCKQVIQDLILNPAVEQLDPDRHGIALSLVRCMPPRCGQKVRSLHEISGLGTHPWKHDLEQKKFFFGAESLVGSTVTNTYVRVLNSREEMTFFPAHWTEYEMSAAAVPILRHAMVAGCLVASSAVEHFFSATHISILKQYAYLAALIFEPEEFYTFEALDLQMMPPYTQQVVYFRDFNQRVSQKFALALCQQCSITLPEAQRCVWQDLEEELLQVFIQSKA